MDYIRPERHFLTTQILDNCKILIKIIRFFLNRNSIIIINRCYIGNLKASRIVLLIISIIKMVVFLAYKFSICYIWSGHFILSLKIRLYERPNNRPFNRDYCWLMTVSPEGTSCRLEVSWLNLWYIKNNDDKNTWLAKMHRVEWVSTFSEDNMLTMGEKCSRINLCLCQCILKIASRFLCVFIPVYLLTHTLTHKHTHTHTHTYIYIQNRNKRKR